MSSPAPEPTPGLTALRSWCGWHITPPRSETLKVESDGGNALLVPSLFIRSVAEIRDEAGDLVPTADYRWRANGIIRGRWREHELYSITLTHGYEKLPVELIDIVSDLGDGGVGRTLAARTAGPFSQTYGSTSDLEAQPITVRSIVDRYRIPAGL